jgi:plasmid stabilization system protein ParE
MTDFNYNDVIEYVDDTFDENFEAAKKWAREHNTTLEELIDRRETRKVEEEYEEEGETKTREVEKLFRYFKIGTEPKPYVPTEDEMKESVKRIRNSYLQQTDFTQLPDAPFTSKEKAQYAEYRQYLRDYTKEENWWLQNPKTFEEWKSLTNQS